MIKFLKVWCIVLCTLFLSFHVLYAQDDFTAKQQVIRNYLTEKWGVSGQPIKATRKSCNCGCLILRELYKHVDKKTTFEIVDFCDSKVITFKSATLSVDEALRDVMDALRAAEDNRINQPIVTTKQRKNTVLSSYTSNDLTFLEITSYPSKGIMVKLSLASH